ncbi:BREX-1 system adenine-specific DNA-methyltransferase PglX, partial [Escherichia coli]|nr:BREX-1 system adenine-specific DNA-methyltransferase PglX [Escherichia coli]
MQSWMFLSSYEQLRSNLLEDHTFITMAHLGARAFSQISGEVVQTTAWIIRNQNINKYQPTFYRLIDGNEEEKKKALLNRENELAETAQ